MKLISGCSSQIHHSSLKFQQMSIRNNKLAQLKLNIYLTHLLRGRQACLWSDLKYNFMPYLALYLIWHPRINKLVRQQTIFRTSNVDLSSNLLRYMLDTVEQTHLGLSFMFLGALLAYRCASGE